MFKTLTASILAPVVAAPAASPETIDPRINASIRATELNAWIADWTPRIQGKIVLVGRHTPVAVNLEPAVLRGSDEQLRAQYNPDAPPGQAGGGQPAAAVLRDLFKPWEDFGAMGATSMNSRRPGGTDSTSFNEAGLPGIGLSRTRSSTGPTRGTPTSARTSGSSRRT